MWIVTNKSRCSLATLCPLSSIIEPPKQNNWFAKLKIDVRHQSLRFKKFWNVFSEWCAEIMRPGCVFASFQWINNNAVSDLMLVFNLSPLFALANNGKDVSVFAWPSWCRDVRFELNWHEFVCKWFMCFILVWSYFESSPLFQIFLIFPPSFADIPGEFMLECGGMIADDGFWFDMNWWNGMIHSNKPVTKAKLQQT